MISAQQQLCLHNLSAGGFDHGSLSKTEQRVPLTRVRPVHLQSWCYQQQSLTHPAIQVTQFSLGQPQQLQRMVLATRQSRHLANGSVMHTYLQYIRSPQQSLAQLSAALGKLLSASSTMHVRTYMFSCTASGSDSDLIH